VWSMPPICCERKQCVAIEALHQLLRHVGTESGVAPKMLRSDRILGRTREVGCVGRESMFIVLPTMAMGLWMTQAVVEHDFVWDNILVYHVP
jgi:hypothetical protein